MSRLVDDLAAALAQASHQLGNFATEAQRREWAGLIARATDAPRRRRAAAGRPTNASLRRFA